MGEPIRAGVVGCGVDVVLNLTSPDEHADVALRAMRMGKPVYNEKPSDGKVMAVSKIGTP